MSDNLKTWPEKIWLSSTEDDIEPFGEVEKHHVEWESEKSFGGDIEYIRAGLAQPVVLKNQPWHAPGMGEVHSQDHFCDIQCYATDDIDADPISSDDLATKVCAALNAFDSQPVAPVVGEPFDWQYRYRHDNHNKPSPWIRQGWGFTTKQEVLDHFPNVEFIDLFTVPAPHKKTLTDENIAAAINQIFEIDEGDGREYPEAFSKAAEMNKIIRALLEGTKP